VAQAYCTNCGAMLGAGTRFCGACGTPADDAPLLGEPSAGPRPSEPRNPAGSFAIFQGIVSFIASDMSVGKLAGMFDQPAPGM